MGRVIVFCLLMAFAVDSLHANNPILPDWYADPQIRLYGDTYWIFPTPSKEFKEQIYLDAFSSKDLKTWKKHPNIMTTNAFPWAKGAVWAPDAIEKSGRYYIFFGANNAYPIDRAKRDFRLSDRFDLSKRGGIGVGVADRPEGPYRDLIGKPLIEEFWNAAQPIDQYVFEYKAFELLCFIPRSLKNN